MGIVFITVASGLVTGILLALTGAGGTLVAVPLLTFILQLRVVEAAPVALLAVSLSSAVGAVLAHRQGLVRYRAAGFVAITGIATAPAGIWMAQKLPDTFLTCLFALILFGVAVSMFRQSRERDGETGNTGNTATSGLYTTMPCQLAYDGNRLVWTWPCARALAAAGMVSGLLSGLLGVGGGFIVIPVLQRATQLPMSSILATALAITASISATGVLSATMIQGMNWSIALPFAAGTLMGMLGGRIIAGKLSGPRLQHVFAVVAMGIAIAMVLRLFL